MSGVVDALRHSPHPSYFSLADALGWIERLTPKRAIPNLHAILIITLRRAAVARRPARRYWRSNPRISTFLLAII
jgi:hypothetical protein